ncbi:nitrate- and nitrite sensing domain-containing protein [Nocardia sp. BMG111209]|uniref:nitrate- and nitrite sensing domain-containing protein n=1 Tax=Nocardia sp. BMG111209 TaxID=1160137 RepID=UPI0003A0CE50|nr:nitrate- and nitrite sensing domain-containing protein [Nocardia sp. BMG111209]
MQFRRAPLLPADGDRRRRRLPTIRGQLTRMLMVSVVLVLALLAVIVVDVSGRYRASQDTVRAIGLASAVQDFVHEAQRERGLSVGVADGQNSMHDQLIGQRGAVDAARRALDTALADGGVPGNSEVRSALQQFAGLTATRADLDTHRIDATRVFRFYTDAIAAVQRVRPGADLARDTDLWRDLQALYALGDLKEYTGQTRGFLNGVFAKDGFDQGEYVQFSDIRGLRQAAQADFVRDATAAQRARLDAVFRSENAGRAAASEGVAIASSDGPLTRSIDPNIWWANMSGLIDAERDVQRSVAADTVHRAEHLRNLAGIQLIGCLAVALLALLAQIAVTIATVRSIARPLTALANEADEVAGHRLPELISAWQAEAEPAPPEPIRTKARASAEIASVAQALDRVQTTAFELASQQALLRHNTSESLANLGRRNQNLVRRQLGLISQFEQEELDPKALANMFELDHLATRMRRNAESLLVLVGEASPRRWTESIALTDVIRAALSEVEDYRRVILRRVDDVPVAGSSVSELAHMVAELIENGLAFSPPDLEVEIYGRRLGRQYMLAVVDHGVGMPPEALAEANSRLRGETDFLLAPTRYLGHYVVGRLAARLGVEVELTVSPVSGVVARMLLPAELLAEPPAVTEGKPEPLRGVKAESLPGIAKPQSIPAAPPSSPPARTEPAGPDRHRRIAAAEPRSVTAAEPRHGTATDLRTAAAAELRSATTSEPRAATASELRAATAAELRAVTAPESRGTTVPESRTATAPESRTATTAESPGVAADRSYRSATSEPRKTTAAQPHRGAASEPHAAGPGPQPRPAAANPAAPEPVPPRAGIPLSPLGDPVPASPAGTIVPGEALVIDATGFTVHDEAIHRVPDHAPPLADRPHQEQAQDRPRKDTVPAINGHVHPDRGPRPDPFPTMPAGPFKDQLEAAVTQRHEAESFRTGSWPAVGVPGGPDVARTRNGLVKRAKKNRDNVPTDRTVRTPRPPADPAADRSPEQIRGMLADFRAGHQRGERTGAPDTRADERQWIPASTTQEETR